MSIEIKQIGKDVSVFTYREACKQPGMYRPVSSEHCRLLVGSSESFGPVIIRPGNGAGIDIQTSIERTGFENYFWIRCSNETITITSDEDGNF